MSQEFFSLGDVAKLLAVKPHRILYALSTGAATEPVLRVAGKRLWTHEEIAGLAEMLKLQTAARWERGQNIDG